MVIGGGQDASAVTTTDHRAGKFEAKFFDKVGFFFLPILYVEFCNGIECLLISLFYFIRFFKKKLGV